MATLPQHGEIIVNLNNGGQIASTVFFSDDPDANPTYYDPNQTVVVPDPGQAFPKAADWVTVVLWPNGSVKSYESQSANGDHVLLNFEQGSPGSSLVFGSDSSMSHGALIYSDIVSSQNHTEVQQDFANGHLTHYLLTSTDSDHPLRVEGTYNASAAGGDDPHLVITLENNQFGAGNPLRAVSDTGNFDLLRLITNDGGSLITNDGGSLITNDGGSFHLITNDGGSLITNDGGSLITNDGGSLQGLAIDQLIGKEAARIIGNDGASLIATGASGIISNDGASFGPSGFLSGGPGTQGEGSINLLANLQASLAHNFSHYEALTDDSGDVGSQAGASNVALGVEVNGNIGSTGQAVWYKFHLDAGQSYVFDLKGQASASGTLFDPYLRLLDSNGNLITQVDDGGTGSDSRLAFTATASGDVYLVARAFNDAGTGSFTFSAAIAPVGPTIFSNGGGDTAVINVAENISTSDSTTIAVVQGFDLTDGATLHYSISGEDAGDFDLNQFNGILAFHLPIDYENPHDTNHDNIYHIVLTATDSDGNIDSQVLTVNVQDVVEPVYGSHGDDVIDASYHDSSGNGPGAAGEWIFALSGNDLVAAFGGNDSIQGGPGNDTIDGGDGVDSAVYVGDRAQYSIARDQLTGTIVVAGPDGTDVLTNVEQLLFDDQIVVLQIRGTSGSDVLEGTTGDDELNPVSGTNDSVDGKGGVDRLVVDYSAAQAEVTFVTYNVVVDNVSTIFHSIRAGGQNAPLDEVFYTNIEAFTVRGSTSHSNVLHGDSRDDVLIGGSAADTLTGLGGNDIIDVGKGGATAADTGADIVDLGSGDDDLLIVDYAAATVAITFGTLGGASGAGDYYSAGLNGGQYGGTGRLSFTGVERFNISTGSGNDSITTGANNDTIIAGGGNDTLDSGAGEAVIDGGAGVDQWKADLSQFASGITLNLTDPSIQQQLGVGTTVRNIERLGLTATQHNDQITLGASFASADNTISSLGGSDTVTLHGGATAATSGNNTIDLGSGDDDLLIVDYAAATVAITFGTLGGASGAGDYYSAGLNGGQYGGTGRLSFTGVERFNISTGSGNDSITTGANNDTIIAGGGNDTLDSGAGEAVIDGGAGVDQWKADLSQFASGITLNLTDPSIQQQLGVGTTVRNIERLGLTATQHNDQITLGASFASADNTISSLGGSDTVTLHGGATAATSGNNTIDLGSGDDDLLIVDYAAATVAITFGTLGGASGAGDYYSAGLNGGQFGGTGRLSFTGVERFNISTGSGNDSITTGANNDTIIAGGGNDTVSAGGGSDTIGFNGAWRDYDISISGNEVILHDRRVGDPTGTDHVFDAELFSFTSGVLTLSHLANHAPTNVSLSGSTIRENASNGTVVGNLSASDADNALGDTATYTLLDNAGGRFAISGSSIVVANGAQLNYESATSHDLSVKVTDAGGLSFVKTLSISVSDAAEPIGSISDLDGSAGGAIAENSAAGNAVGIKARAIDPDAADHPVHYSLDNNGLGHFVIDNLTGVVTTSAARIDREMDGSTLTIVVRATSPDTSFSTKTFTITVNNVSGVNIVGTSGADFIDATHSLPGQPLPTNEEDIILGAAGNDRIAALGGNDSVDGGAGNDTIIGGAGNDTLNGGANVDTADFSDKTVKVIVTLAGGSGTATFIGSTEHDALIGIENLTGGSAGDALTGDAAANVLIGNGGNDTLIGGNGNDTLRGGADNDTLNGGANVDTADFSDKTVKVIVTLAGGSGTATFIGSTEHDALIGIENLTGGSAGDALTGDAAANVLIGNGGNDTLIGGNGNDTLRGGADNDTLNGGANVDTADFSDKTVKVIVTLAGGSGTATFIGSTEHDALIGIENLTGGSAGDALTGDAAANVLIGNGGNDTLRGGLGADHLTGGSNTDFFRFDTTLGATNIDTITDFSHADDTIQLENAIMTALGSSWSSGQFRVATSGHSATTTSQHVIYDQSNGTLWYDSDGNKVGGHAAIEIAQLGSTVSHPMNLDYTDFAIV